MIFHFPVTCLDLEQIHQSGQCFRMRPLTSKDSSPDTPDGFFLISGLHLAKAWQKEDELYLDCCGENLPFWRSYLDLDRDYEAVIRSIDPANTYLAQAARFGQGIRILNQDPWEMIITFVISQQKTIPAIRSLVETLSRNYGSPIPGSDLFSFPDPKQLSLASLEDLMALKLGYRAKYIHRLCSDAITGVLDLDYLSSLDYKQSMDHLTGFYGIGKKVANCVCLFGLHHIDAFPIDTWIEKILMEQYFDKKRHSRIPKNRLCEAITEEVFGQYSGCAGIMQQYIFHFERNVKRKGQQ